MPTPQPPAPTTLAGALALAIADGRAMLARSDETYRFRALQWHTPQHTSADAMPVCLVCAAGAVMAGTLKVAPKDLVYPGMFDTPWENTLEAIDALRAGAWHVAWNEMHPRTRLEQRGAEFARCVDARLSETGVSRPTVVDLADFAGAEQYARWLDWVEHALAPIIETEERAALDRLKRASA